MPYSRPIPAVDMDFCVRLSFPGRQRCADIQLDFRSQPFRVRPVAGADAILQPIEDERSRNGRSASFLLRPQGHLHVAAIALDFKRTLHGMHITLRSY